jgi:hypothetical protein
MDISLAAYTGVKLVESYRSHETDGEKRLGIRSLRQSLAVPSAESEFSDFGKVKLPHLHGRDHHVE